MYYKNNVEQFAEEFIDYIFSLGGRAPCWFRRLCILLFPISLPIWMVLIFLSMIIYIMSTAQIVEAWKCKHD